MDKAPKITAIERGFDRIISFVSPKLALERAVNRQHFIEFSFDGAKNNGHRTLAGSRQRNASPENFQSRRDGIRLMWEARQAANDICLIRGLMLKIPKYVVGRLEYKADTGDKDVDKMYEDYFHQWCESCDITGRFRFLELVQKSLRSMLIDGDVGALMRIVQGQIKVQVIEADRIGSPDEADISDSRVRGIEIGDFGEVLGYRVYKRSLTSSQYTYEKTFSPEVFKHLMDPFRTDQYRPTTYLATALPHVRDLYELFGFEKVANKFASMWSAFVTRKDPYNNQASSGWDTETVDGRKQWEAVPGRVQVLGEGENISMANGSSRPSGQFMAFCQMLIREACISMDLPYGFGYDMSIMGGATSRIELEQAQRTFEYWQGLLTHRMLNPIKNAVIEHGISMGSIPATPNYVSGEWSFGSQITADVTYAGQMDIANIQLGLESMTDVLSKRGKDIETVARKRARDVTTFQEAAASNNVPIEMLSNQWPMASDQLAAANTPPQPPPPGLINNTQDLKPLMDLISQVGEGVIERVSAVESAMAIYGIGQQEAEMLIPESTGLAQKQAKAAAQQPKEPSK